MGRARRTVGVVAAVALAVVAVACDPQDPTLTRTDEPVVVTGAQLAPLDGVPVGEVVAFRWTKAGGWSQVPVQVDERRDVDLGSVYGTAPSGVVVNVYADAGTYTRADPVVGLDADDEVVVSSGDAGGKPPAFSEPADVVAGSGVDLRLTDPLAPGEVGHVYLFRSAGGLDPAAGQDRVEYAFDLLAPGSYFNAYRFQDGPNPEDTWVRTDRYQVHFADRWNVDRVHVVEAGVAGADLVDVRKVQFAPSYCGRSVASFDDAEGAFVVNRDGPVRALRSYIGANSGPWTQRTHVFYDDREVVHTDLRVHAIPSVMDFWDLTTGLDATYRNPANPGGVAVDGVPDALGAGFPGWEAVDSPAGSFVAVHEMDSSLSLSPVTYYEDDATAPTTQCTGDADAWGSHGPYVNQGIACTDPEDGCSHHLRTTRTVRYGAPGVDAATAEAQAAEVTQPLAVVARPWVEPAPGG